MSAAMSAGRTAAAGDAAAAPSAAASGVSWGAVIAGGVTAAAISSILLIFGAGLGLASVSPWAGAGVSAPTFTVLAAVWLIIVQWVSAAFGGYMAGRLRTKWVAVHSDEVFFRDTAHGFLAWALGTIIAVALLTSATTSAAGTGAHLAAGAAANATATRYDVDQLFRQNAGGSAIADTAPNPAVTGMSDNDMREQAATILAEDVATGTIPQTDNDYLVQMVAARTGLAPADAQARVNDVLSEIQAAETKTKQIADATRKATAAAAIYTFVSLLIGAFIASVSGAIGGRLRDAY
jgi:hypothetical protein